MKSLPIDYIVDKIYCYCTSIKKHTDQFNFACPICKEGKSIHKKRRGYFFSKDGYFFCHNCQQSWNPAEWIHMVSGSSYKEIYKEARGYTHSIQEIIDKHDSTSEKKVVKNHILPHDCVNLTDSSQLSYYKDNQVVKDCLSYIEERRLSSAINKCNTFYVSLTDKIHRNRLVIPFYDYTGKIIHYQTRAIYTEDEENGKYLSKIGSTKSLFGVNNISEDLDYIFLFEGPIDSMFVKNGTAVAGLTLNSLQLEQLEQFRFHNRVWVLDNQLDNEDVRRQYKDLIDRGEKLVIWPERFKDFKDLNEICVAGKRDSIPPEFLIQNTYSGVDATLKIK